ncbi:hypothetical protein [Methanolobus psychrotolerans]|nr:hypothetical protein [Methanolobus psychrotolerans]
MNKETEEYHIYITNISSDVLDSEYIAKLYGARYSQRMLMINFDQY